MITGAGQLAISGHRLHAPVAVTAPGKPTTSGAVAPTGNSAPTPVARPDSAVAVPPPGMVAKLGPEHLEHLQKFEERKSETEAKDDTDLSEEEQEQVRNLKSRDREVRQHERAHAAAGGQHAGSPSYSYETGPDGQRYAVSGEVSIDSSAVAGDPQATIRKMEQVKAAAMAPAEPSGQDKAVAAAADAQRLAAQAELMTQRAEERAEKFEAGDEEDAKPGSLSPPEDAKPQQVRVDLSI